MCLCCVGVGGWVYALRILSTDKILHFISTLFIINIILFVHCHSSSNISVHSINCYEKVMKNKCVRGESLACTGLHTETVCKS